MSLQATEESRLSPREEFIVSRLRREFFNKVQKNSRYSLRAFAQSLRVDQSHLSKIISKKVRLSEKMIFHLSSLLEIKPAELDSANDGNFDSIEEETFETISNWIHFAILELMKTKNFTYDPKWIAKRLNTNAAVIESAVGRLVKIGILKTDKRKLLSFTKKSLEWNNTEKTTFARKTLQKELLKKSIECIDKIDMEQRENSSLTVALPMSLIPELKREIIKFKNKINQLCEEQNSNAEVYQLCVSLFPLTNLEDQS